MTKDEKTMTKWGVIITFALILIFSVTIYRSGIKQAEEEIKKEIESVQEALDAGTFEKKDINSLRTDEAKEFAESAFKEWKKIVEEYPVPEIELINPHKMLLFDDSESWISAGDDKYYKSDTGELMEEGDFIVDPLGNVTEILIRFKAMDAEQAFVNERGSWDREEYIKEAFLDDDGIYSYLLPLEDVENEIKITAINKFKEDSIDVFIYRNENVEERQSRLAIEAKQSKWNNSKAGKLCAKYPSWSNSDCKNVADNKYWIGMSLDMLKAQRGTPNSANPSDYGYGTSWQWCWWDYTPSCFYGDDAGIIDSYN